ncbi:MAG: HopJ type III effector protein [Methylococcaceae bacterium]|jgi:hypothetical protein
MTSLENFLHTVRQGQPVSFDDTIAQIAAHYRYVPTGFSNGLDDARLDNAAGVNEGSCKIFSFARINGLTEAETLGLFGDFYRRDVLGNPVGTDHRNIRNFMQYGWEGIVFEGEALLPVEA